VRGEEAMLGVMEAYQGLLDFAARGREFVHGEVFSPPAEDGDPRMSQPVGRGYDFTRTVMLPGVQGSDPVEGIAALRILRMVGDDGAIELFLRARLTWVSPYGEHRSYACYEISPEAAAALSEAPTPRDRATRKSRV
jgi:hypothetical protein